MIEQEPVDLVLADIRMPVMDGVEFARQMAQRADPPGVIFTTAYDEYAVTAFDVEAVDYLVKPVRAGRLAAALARFKRSRVAEPVVDGVGRKGASISVLPNAAESCWCRSTKCAISRPK